jgi:hypothetical protein
MEEKKNPSFLRAAEMKVKVEEQAPVVQQQAPVEATVASSYVRASDSAATTKKPTVTVPKDMIEKVMNGEVSIEDIEEMEETIEKPAVEQPKQQSLKLKISPTPKTSTNVEEVKKMLSKTKDEIPAFESSEELEAPVDISEFIDTENNEVEVKKELAKPEKEVKKAKKVDISNLTIVNKNEMDKERDLRQALFNNKAAFQIVAVQSGYMAKVSPLVHKDIVNILYGNLGRYEYKKSVYKTIHEKMFDTSVGKMSFDEWLKYTSVEDMETFYYGVYSSTFPNEGSFRYTCSKCGVEHDYKVNHANLIKTTDREHMKRLIEDVSLNSTSIEKMREFSLVGKGEAIQLTESQLIIELKTPSLFDSLEILRTVPEKTIDKDTISVTNMLYINRVLIPSKESAYTEEAGKTSILRIIDGLPINDANELQQAVFERVDKNRITYSIKNIKCVECAHEEKEIPLSIEDILFTLIFEKTQ